MESIEQNSSKGLDDLKLKLYAIIAGMEAIGASEDTNRQQHLCALAEMGESLIQKMGKTD